MLRRSRVNTSPLLQQSHFQSKSGCSYCEEFFQLLWKLEGLLDYLDTQISFGMRNRLEKGDDNAHVKAKRVLSGLIFSFICLC